jgi:hypothetical protein
MKIAAGILVLLGLGNLAGIIPAVQSGAKLDTLFAVLIGCACLGVAAGILKKKSFAWPLGFVVIGLGALYVPINALPFAFGKEGVERTVLVSSCVVGPLLVAAYWSRVWYRQRSYFTQNEETA